MQHLPFSARQHRYGPRDGGSVYAVFGFFALAREEGTDEEMPDRACAHADSNRLYISRNAAVVPSAAHTHSLSNNGNEMNQTPLFSFLPAVSVETVGASLLSMCHATMTMTMTMTMTHFPRYTDNNIIP